MKLTNYIRDAFIRSAMDDVPMVNHAERAEKVAHAALDAMFAKTFPKLDRLKVGESGWLDKSGVKMPAGLPNIYTFSPGYACLEGDAKTWSALKALAEKASEQDNARGDLESKLRSIAYSVTTRKALAEALPEFAKYLPAETETSRSLPVVANVVSDFVKAGWPKGKKQPVAA